MPKSKRARVFHLSKVEKKGKELTEKLFSNVQECLEKYQYCFVFSVENMRNAYLKQVRTELSDSRLFFGKTKVMAKALGTSEESSTQPNTHRLAAHLVGNVGLLFTSREPSSIISHFNTYAETDFARAGNPAARSFTVPAGTVYSMGGEMAAEDDVPMAHSMEPELRKLGMPTSLVRGKITLHNDHEVCKEGQILDSRQTRLLKLFGVAMAEFKVKLVAYWSMATHEVTVLDSEPMEE